MDLGVNQVDDMPTVTTTSLDHHVNSNHKVQHGNNRRHFRHQYSTASSGKSFLYTDFDKIIIFVSCLDSITYHQDPFNQVELVNTLRGKELLAFVLCYLLAVLFILAVFETVMPIVFS